MSSPGAVARRADPHRELAALQALWCDLSRRSFGMPLNQSKPDLSPLGLSGLATFTLNNLGDPFDDGSYLLNSKEQEREVVAWLGHAYGLHDGAWGYVTSCGSEGNFFGVYLGREVLRRYHTPPLLVHSAAAHYSIPKAANMLAVEAVAVPSLPNGEIDYRQFEDVIRLYRDRPLIIALSIGTTLTGAVDSVEQTVELLDQLDISHYHIHCDAALLGWMLPFMDGEMPVHFDFPIGSLSTSAHKFPASPLPSGVVITRASLIRQLPQRKQVTGARDLTFGGSRSGLAALVLWYLLQRPPSELQAEIACCIRNAAYMHGQLCSHGWWTIHNPPGPTVAFRRPRNQDLLRHYQVSVQGDVARVVVLPHIDRPAIDQFLADLFASSPVP